MKAFREELMRYGLNVASFKDVWQKARKGDQAARKIVFEVTSKSEVGRNLVNSWADERTKRLEKAQAQRDAKRANPTEKPKTLSQWQKSQRTLGKSGAWVIPGGLPSLGKHSK